ncbi:hypothetical protein VaNZ11_009890, partial [Volvox africanus]
RMESHGLAGAVHISAASRALISNPAKYLISERGEIAVKGKGLMETFLVSRADAPTAAHLRSILAASTSPEFAVQVVPIVHPSTVPLHYITATTGTASAPFSPAPSQQRPTWAANGDLCLPSSNALATGQLHALVTSVGGGSSVVGASISGTVAAAVGAAGSDLLRVMDTEASQEAAGPQDSQLYGSLNLDFELVIKDQKMAPVVPSRSAVCPPCSLLPTVKHDPLPPPHTVTTLQPVLQPTPPPQQQQHDEEPLLSPGLRQKLQHYQQHRHQQHQDQHQQKPLQLQSTIRAAVQLVPEHVPKVHQNQRSAMFFRSHSSIDVTEAGASGHGVSAHGGATTDAGCGSAMVAGMVAGMPVSTNAVPVPYSPWGGASDRPLPLSASTTSTGVGIGIGVGGADNTTPTTRRRLLLGARRPREPSFYLRHNITPINSLPQVDLPELEAVLQSQATNAHTTSLEQNTISPFVLNSHPNPHPPGSLLPTLMAVEPSQLPPQPPPQPQLQADSPAHEAGFPSPVRRVFPLHVLATGMQPPQPQLELYVRMPPPAGESVACPAHADAVQDQLRQRSLLTETVVLQPQLQHQHQYHHQRHHHQLQHQNADLCKPQLNPPPLSLPVMMPEAVWLPYEDEFTNVRHRITRREEENDEVEYEYWI